MVQDYFDTPVAYNPDADQLVAGASFQVYAVTDTSLSTPLTPLDAVSGTPIANLRSSSIGVLPAFRVAGDPAQVILRSGTFTTRLTSKYGIFLEVVPNPDQLLAAIASGDRAEAALAQIPDLLAAEAGPAVDAEVLSRDLINGEDPRVPVVTSIPGVLIAILDELRRRTWLEANDVDGGPTARAASYISAAVTWASMTPEARAAIADGALSSRFASLAYGDEVLVAVTDAEKHRTWLEARRSDGGPTDRALGLILPRLGLGADSIPLPWLSPEVRARLAPTGVHGLVPRIEGASVVIDDPVSGLRRTVAAEGVSDVRLTADGWVEWDTPAGSWGISSFDADPVRAVSRVTHWSMWGDSLTAAGSIRAELLGLLPVGSVVVNEGIGGQRPVEIEARATGTCYVTVMGNQIPASGPVTCTNVPVKFFYGYAGPNGEEPAVSRHGTLAGVPGVMSKAAVAAGGTPVYVFTRDTPGAAVACPAGTPFVMDSAVEGRDHVAFIWTGRNNINDNVRDRVRRMVEFLTPHTKRFLVISPTTATTEIAGSSAHTRFVQVGAELAADWGDRYVDIRRYYIDHGLADAGITPTADDLNAIAGDTIPPSLMRVGDSIHFNDAAQQLHAHQLFERAQQNGWLS